MARKEDDTCLVLLGGMLKRKNVIFFTGKLHLQFCIQQILNKQPHSPPYFYERYHFSQEFVGFYKKGYVRSWQWFRPFLAIWNLSESYFSSHKWQTNGIAAASLWPDIYLPLPSLLLPKYSISVANSASRSSCSHAFDGGKILDVKLHKFWEDKKFPNSCTRTYGNCVIHMHFCVYSSPKMGLWLEPTFKLLIMRLSKLFFV
jgi:hypothetical protein